MRRALHQVSARFRPRPGRTHQFAASAFANASAPPITQIAPAHFEVVKADETVNADSGRAQIANGKDLVAPLLARLEPSLRSGSR